MGRRGYIGGAGRGGGNIYNQAGAGFAGQAAAGIAGAAGYRALVPDKFTKTPARYQAGVRRGALMNMGMQSYVTSNEPIQRRALLGHLARIAGPLAAGYATFRTGTAAYAAGGQQEAWEIGFRNVGGNLAGLRQVEAFNAVTPFSSQQLNPLMLGLMAALGGDNNRAFGIVQSAATLGALSSLKTGNTRGFDRISYHTQAAASRGSGANRAVE